MTDWYTINIVDIGIPGLLDLSTIARDVIHFVLTLDLSDLSPTDDSPPATYAEAKQNRQAMEIMLTAANTLRRLEMNSSRPLDELLSPDCRAMVSGLLLANTLSSLTTLELFGVCFDIADILEARA